MTDRSSSLAWFLVSLFVLTATFAVAYHYIGRWSLLTTALAAAFLLALNVPKEEY